MRPWRLAVATLALVGAVVGVRALLRPAPVAVALVHRLGPLRPVDPQGLGRLHAYALVVADGPVLAALRGRTAYPIASTTKIMTAYLALKTLSLDATVRVRPDDLAASAEQESMGGVEMPLTLGERLSVHDVLEALLLPSANNAAVLLAQASAGSQAAFVRRMNAQARRLGMTDTHYADVAGLDNATRSSALDLVRLAEAALRLRAFDRLVGTRTALVPGWGRVVNLNELLFTYPGTIGVKTGYTDAAGNCLVFAARRRVGGRRVTVVGALLGVGQPQTMFADARSLLDLGFASARPIRLWPAGAVLAALRAPADGPVVGRLALTRAVWLPRYVRAAGVTLRVRPLGRASGAMRRWRLVVFDAHGRSVASVPLRLERGAGG